MARATFLALLAALVDAEHLALPEAAALLRAFDADELPDATLPLAGAAAIPLLSLGDGAASLASLPPVLRAARAATPWSAGPINALQGAFEREVARRTALLFAPPDLATLGGLPGSAHRSAGNVRRWHVAMRQALAEDTLAAATLGRGRALTALELAAVQTQVATQALYLERFAGEVSARALVGRPLSEKQIAARARMYGGAPRGEYWRAAAAEARPDLLLDFNAADDRGTCGPCASAAAGSPYRADDPSLPLPGVVCAGRGLCRCTLAPA